ncbi:MULTISPECIES: reverse transcriptase domain-containing protein [Aeromonas]|jgi:hypothetical protein|uniref:reverse transcriptase domain-containing protein n=1 Tax=Aeromonas TaxID=642 RepID=UPI001495EDAB|nr:MULTISPECIES: reverse transcriptase domain-containing protein [Aeromonas]MBA8780329.1 RNA-directed DNA polymerase [Aeromonas caviae]MBA8784384.1 RNA-directed DNA polymerase [Aeromonas sp. TW 6]
MNEMNKDFFINAILNKDETLLNTFKPSVVEHQVGDDFFFEIQDRTPHKNINKRITNIILSQIPLNSSACGFIRSKSYYDFLQPHVTGYYFLRLDIKNFFHTIDSDLIDDLLLSLFSDEKKGSDTLSPFDIASLVVTHKVSESCSCELINGKRILPIGFPSSPVISNIIFRKIDLIIQKFCDDKRVKYTRYADDLLFSSPDNKFIHSEQFEKEISIFVAILNLKLNKKKRIACENTISLNGYVIQNEKGKKTRHLHVYKEEPVGTIRLSIKKTKIIQKMVYLLDKKIAPVTIVSKLFKINYHTHKFKYRRNLEFFKKYADDQLQNKLKGYRSYLLSIINYNKIKPCVSTEHIDKYLYLVDKINSYIKE